METVESGTMTKDLAGCIHGLSKYVHVDINAVFYGALKLPIEVVMRVHKRFSLMATRFKSL